MFAGFWLGHFPWRLLGNDEVDYLNVVLTAGNDKPALQPNSAGLICCRWDCASVQRERRSHL